MKLYWGPHTCAIGIHILLEEIGKPYETEKIDVAGGSTHEEPFRSINPKGKVPTLVRDDGSVLTEYSAIATWLARTNAERGFLPSDPDSEARALEIMDYSVATLHGLGFARVFLPQTFEPPDALHETLGLGKTAIKKQGHEVVTQALEILNREMDGKPYAAGDAFTIADTALFYVERWAPQVSIELPRNLGAHFERMKARPAVARVRKIWGEA